MQERVRVHPCLLSIKQTKHVVRRGAISNDYVTINKYQRPDVTRHDQQHKILEKRRV